MADDIFTNQLPPQDLPAERALLGSIFLDPDMFTLVREFVGENDFYRSAHALIFRAMVNLADRGEAVDVITVQNELKRQGQLENAGGYDYFYEIAEKTPTPHNAEYYAKIVEGKSLLRGLIKVSQQIQNDCFTEEKAIEQILDEAEGKILSVSEHRNRGAMLPIGEVVQEAVKELNDLSKLDQAVTGLPTGYHDLDMMTTGLHEDELIIVAARPGMGKTAFALNIAQNVATKQGATVALFSLEMGAKQLVNRMLCAEGSIDANHMRTGRLSSEEWSDLMVAMGELGEAAIYIDDTPGIHVNEIRAKARRLKQKTKRLDLVVIDYLQLIESHGRRENRQQEVSEISRQLKKLAKELNAPVVALSQLSRSVESRQDKRPILSDLRESGSIEQDADIVAFLYREDYYQRDDGDDALVDNTIEVIIEKNRSGARGTVKLIFTKEFNKFSSISYRDDAPEF